MGIKLFDLIQTASFDIFKNFDTFEKMSESNLLARKKFN